MVCTPAEPPSKRLCRVLSPGFRWVFLSRVRHTSSPPNIRVTRRKVAGEAGRRKS